MRAAPLFLALLLAGCAAAPPPPAAPPARTTHLGSLAAFGNATWHFDPDTAVLAGESYFTLDEGNRTLRQHSPVLVPGAFLLRLIGFGDYGWAVWSGHSAQLDFSDPSGSTAFLLLGSEAWLRLEQLPQVTGTFCAGTQRTDAGEQREVGGAPWSTGAQPGGGGLELAFEGPGPCAGLTLRLSHLGAWTVAAPS